MREEGQGRFTGRVNAACEQRERARQRGVRADEQRSTRSSSVGAGVVSLRSAAQAQRGNCSWYPEVTCSRGQQRSSAVQCSGNRSGGARHVMSFEPLDGNRHAGRCANNLSTNVWLAPQREHEHGCRHFPMLQMRSRAFNAGNTNARDQSAPDEMKYCRTPLAYRDQTKAKMHASRLFQLQDHINV